jgi:hypothetical protein
MGTGSRDPVDPERRRAVVALDGVPTHAELQPAGEERPLDPEEDKALKAQYPEPVKWRAPGAVS